MYEPALFLHVALVSSARDTTASPSLINPASFVDLPPILSVAMIGMESPVWSLLLVGFSLQTSSSVPVPKPPGYLDTRPRALERSIQIFLRAEAMTSSARNCTTASSNLRTASINALFCCPSSVSPTLLVILLGNTKGAHAERLE